MSTTTICVDCNAIAPQEDTRYTLIGSGWRVSKRETPDGTAVEWRCAGCWRDYKIARSMHSTGEFPAAASSGRMRSDVRTAK
jgi:hypothetical protein